MASIDQVVHRMIKDRCAALERRAKVALMFFPPCQLTWQYHQGEDTPRLAVHVGQRRT